MLANTHNLEALIAQLILNNAKAILFFVEPPQSILIFGKSKWLIILISGIIFFTIFFF